MEQQRYSGYQGRSFWYMKYFGVPIDIHKSLMEDGKTRLGVMEFGPVQNERLRRSHWVYATNGMSERRMPCEEKPHGEIRNFETEPDCLFRFASAPWIIELLSSMAHYPFVHRSGFMANHTIPVTNPNPHLWDGYLLLAPPAEPEEINPLAVDIGIGADWVFHLQIIGLKMPELEFAIKNGGSDFAANNLARFGGNEETQTIFCSSRPSEEESLVKRSQRKTAVFHFVELNQWKKLHSVRKFFHCSGLRNKVQYPPPTARSMPPEDERRAIQQMKLIHSDVLMLQPAYRNQNSKADIPAQSPDPLRQGLENRPIHLLEP